MATYPRLNSMKLSATFPLSLFLSFLIFSLVMAEEDQRKEIPVEQSLSSISGDMADADLIQDIPVEQSLPSIEQPSNSYLLIFTHLLISIIS